VDAISREVTLAIAARFEAALEARDGTGLADIVGRLFAVEPAGTGAVRPLDSAS
jgi:hypothetical protein